MADSEARDGGKRELRGDEDPWPLRCERLAIALVVVVVAALAQAIFLGSATSLPHGVKFTFVERLRLASQVLNSFHGVVLLIAVALVALDGIASGERRGYSTALGRTALVAALVLSVVVSVGSAARLIDALTGHLFPTGPAPGGHWSERLSIVVSQLASIVAALAAGWFALLVLDDARALNGTGPSGPDEENEEVPS